MFYSKPPFLCVILSIFQNKSETFTFWIAFLTVFSFFLIFFLISVPTLLVVEGDFDSLFFSSAIVSFKRPIFLWFANHYRLVSTKVSLTRLLRSFIFVHFRSCCRSSHFSRLSSLSFVLFAAFHILCHQPGTQLAHLRTYRAYRHESRVVRFIVLHPFFLLPLRTFVRTSDAVPQSLSRFFVSLLTRHSFTIHTSRIRPPTSAQLQRLPLQEPAHRRFGKSILQCLRSRQPYQHGLSFTLCRAFSGRSLRRNDYQWVFSFRYSLLILVSFRNIPRQLVNYVLCVGYLLFQG